MSTRFSNRSRNQPYRPWLIAHRGDSADYPENTQAAFASAIAAGVDAIELDVRLSKDGIPVVCHDATLARFGGSHKSVRTMSLASLQAVDIGSWKAPKFKTQRIMTLAAVLKQCRQIVVCIELKATAGRGAEAYHRRLVKAVLQCVRAQKAEQRVRLLCFHAGVLQLCARQAPAIKRVRNCERLPKDRDTWLDQQRGCTAICFDHRLVTVSVVAAAQERGYQVFAYSANAVGVATHLVQCGVDGILSDRPAWLVATVRRR